MKKQKSEYAIQTVTNALRLLEAFRNEEELGVTELSRRLDLHKNNVFRLLATLELPGYITQSPASGCYRLGTACLELGQAYVRGCSLLRRARPFLEELAARSGESVHLAAMRDFAVVHLDGRRSNHLVSSGVRIGQRLPLHCTALGKVLLGCAPEAVRQEYDRSCAANGALVARTPATIVDVHKLFENVHSAAVRGYALDVGECEHGLSCAAAPVFGDAGEVVAALSVSAPSFRVQEERLLNEIVPLVTSVAERLSRALGFVNAVN